METGGSKKRTDNNESPFAVIPKSLRVILEQCLDLCVPPAFQPIYNLSVPLGFQPIHNLSVPPGFQPLLPNAKRHNQVIDEPYVSDIYEYLRMMEIEEKRKPDIDYIETVQRCMTKNMRGTLVDWLVEVADEYIQASP